MATAPAQSNSKVAPARGLRRQLHERLGGSQCQIRPLLLQAQLSEAIKKQGCSWISPTSHAALSHTLQPILQAVFRGSWLKTLHGQNGQIVQAAQQPWVKLQCLAVVLLSRLGVALGLELASLFVQRPGLLLCRSRNHSMQTVIFTKLGG
ncbi:MAG: hypothetical protein VKM98_10495 [Cyanobacteriota bacterium]|nr:hypothetical protein [Cyanobacteriota bacterium]